MTTSLIFNKIAIPAELPRISRRRLIEKLSRSLATCNLTVINGRAGTGKTLLATDFAWQCGRPVAWYKVDASDSDPAVFFRYLIASVARQQSGFGRHWAEESLKKDMPRLAESFAHEMDQAAMPLVLVLDDLHLIYDAEWVAPFFSRFWPLLPVEAHLIIIGRIPPPLPLWRMRSKQTLSVIDETALGFSLLETAMLLESYDLPQPAAFEVLRESRGRASRVSAIVREMLVADRSATLMKSLPQEVIS
ncbi:MAG: hypothetical protein L0229_29220 [Blastocatellia bacterium]|nr:hypothetical protein [Blastocatellia bacterium]